MTINFDPSVTTHLYRVITGPGSHLSDSVPMLMVTVLVAFQ